MRFKECYPNALRRGLIVLLLSAVISALLCGCAGSPFPEQPDRPVAFQTGSYIDEDNDGDGYATIEYEGRTYLPYGTVNRTVTGRDIRRCVGYIVMSADITSVPDPDSTDTRVYTLTDNPENNYLMDYYCKGIMEQPHFWRAADTRGQDIYTPEYIERLGYGYWE